MNKSKKVLSKKQKIIKTSIISIIALAIIVCCVHTLFRVNTIINSPEQLFLESNNASNTPGNPDEISETGSIANTPDVSGQSISDSQSKSISPNNIINILLLGVDRTPDGKTSSGTMEHADAIVVVAVNFDTNTISLVSLPRDSFVNMPDVKGFYKLNCMFNVGGGYSAANGGGFNSMCSAAQWTLGGIPINYYYSVDFEALISLVDAIGGVDFDMDMSYQGEYGYYQKGQQHLDGLGVMDYMRARKNATIGANDRERTNRQKRMLLAIFNQLKGSNLVDTIPKAISSVKGKYFTNTSLEQTLALANFARKIPSDSISTYSLYGDYKAGPIQWNWTFIDPDNRIDVIQKVWGITVNPLECTSYEFMEWLRDYGFLAIKYKSTAENIEAQVKEMNYLTETQQLAYQNFASALQELGFAYDIAARSLDSADTNTMISAQEDLKEKTIELSQEIFFKEKLDWTVASSWCEDTGINEVYVDFR